MTTLYIDSDNGDDNWDGSSPVYVSGTIGPKQTFNYNLPPARGIFPHIAYVGADDYVVKVVGSTMFDTDPGFYFQVDDGTTVVVENYVPGTSWGISGSGYFVNYREGSTNASLTIRGATLETTGSGGFMYSSVSGDLILEDCAFGAMPNMVNLITVLTAGAATRKIVFKGVESLLCTATGPRMFSIGANTQVAQVKFMASDARPTRIDWSGCTTSSNALYALPTGFVLGDLTVTDGSQVKMKNYFVQAQVDITTTIQSVTVDAGSLLQADCIFKFAAVTVTKLRITGVNGRPTLRATGFGVYGGSSGEARARGKDWVIERADLLVKGNCLFVDQYVESIRVRDCYLDSSEAQRSDNLVAFGTDAANDHPLGFLEFTRNTCVIRPCTSGEHAAGFGRGSSSVPAIITDNVFIAERGTGTMPLYGVVIKNEKTIFQRNVLQFRDLDSSQPSPVLLICGNVGSVYTDNVIVLENGSAGADSALVTFNANGLEVPPPPSTDNFFCDNTLICLNPTAFLYVCGEPDTAFDNVINRNRHYMASPRWSLAGSTYTSLASLRAAWEVLYDEGEVQAANDSESEMLTALHQRR